MDDQLAMTRPDAITDKAIDPAVLETVLSIGDKPLRDALLRQLVADFHRIAEALAAGSIDQVGAAAHELKGLAATIGANRLARLARTLNTVADHVAPSDLGLFRAPVEGEIRVVLDRLAHHAGGPHS